MFFVFFFFSFFAVIVPAVSACPLPGYTYNRYFGCLRYVVIPSPINAEAASQFCANEGGQLLLLNSDEEVEELRRLIASYNIVMADGIFVQGKRTTGSSPWIIEDGSPLPYTPPTGIRNENNPSYTRLVFAVDAGFDLVAIPLSNLERFFFCEV